mmetsp:Transcript_10079/g.32872  ORF Transcript_10079/g.32872 Transcript_10079/m.32872 type:complete len:1080 (+) Transcript_10079:122-3361(+)
MLTKFESKSNRVKGLAFHLHRPWILTSLHNGVIQLWDYRMGTLLDRFDEHEGPVRGVDFHRVQPLIVSGGDDYRIKVWDYKLRRCLFTLLGHLDYIRTVCFHNDYPWLVSASDDQTIRIWNWQSRSCVTVLTGHNHYVMCASFHPKDDLIVSASLDQTVRVWDVTGLRNKTVRGMPAQAGGPALNEATGATGSGSVVSRVNADLFGSGDAVVKYVLEGHDRGVNWASFHPSSPLIASGADDRQVKLWRMNDIKAWEVDTMRGHTNNVSCVVFHPKHELIISNSEDRSIRVWDISKRLGVQTFRRENDRFWIIAAHPEQNLLAAGHDAGMIVFKLERERPAFASDQQRLFYVKDRYLRTFDFHNGRDVPSISLRRTGHVGTTAGILARSLECNTLNSTETLLLLCSDAEGGSYELIALGVDASQPIESSDGKRGTGMSATFLSRNRVAILDKNRQILIKDLANERRKVVASPSPATDKIFFAGTSGRLLLRLDDRLLLFETQSRRILSELQVQRVKYVHWSPNNAFVALISKHGITIASRELDQLCSISETVRVKGGVWDSHSKVFVYTTLNHVKYCLTSGDTGTLRTLDMPVYLTQVLKGKLHCLDRECKTRILSIDMTEANFKLALESKNYAEVMHIIRHARLCGEALVAYLQDRGYPEVALHFVKDLTTRFKLAVACGNIQVALSTAYELGDDVSWHHLGVEALRQGNYQVVEMAYQRTKNFERLSFLYLLTGNTDKLRKMLKIAEMRHDLMARFHNALFLGDAEERMRVLEDAGQLALAYLTSATHGLTEQAERLGDRIGPTAISIQRSLELQRGDDSCALLLQPPTPIVRAENWPLLAVSRMSMYELLDSQSRYAPEQDDEDSGETWEAQLGSDIPLSRDVVDEVPGGWDDELELEDELMTATAAIEGSQISTGIMREDDGQAPFHAPPSGVAPMAVWCETACHAAYHAAAGSFETGMHLLYRQIAVVEFRPLKQAFMARALSSLHSLPGLPLALAVVMPVRGQTLTETRASLLPVIPLNMAQLIDLLKHAYKEFQRGNFVTSERIFRTILRTLPLYVAETRAEAQEVRPCKQFQ